MTQTIFPAVRYRDADAALRFLKAAFGATEKSIYRDDAGVIRHGEILISGGLIMIGTADGEAADGPTADAMTLYVVVPEAGGVDAHHATAVAAGADVVRPPQDMDYGSHEYGVRDPEGHAWSFGTYDPNA